MTDDALRPLVGKLSLEQKVRLLTGVDDWSTHAEPAVGLRRMVVSDGPCGIRGETWDEREPSLNLPSATALAATWDPSLAYRYGALLAAEARRKGADVVLGPTINLHRSPLGGRHFEAYSEDPVLTSGLAAAYVRGVQDGGVGACPKHYVANEFETERRTATVVVAERALRELYLVAFEDTVVRERPWLVMAAYNGVNGAPMTENPLLAEPLCGEWGFDGVVVSDWSAIYHTEPSANARVDLEMPGPAGLWGERLVDAVRDGWVPEATVDEKVLRLLRLASRVGALEGFEPPAVPTGEDGAVLAREVAAEAVVLVRNTGVLPLAGDSLGSVAVIGHHALIPSTQGGGSAAVIPPYAVSPLDALREALPDAGVSWSLGALVHDAIAPFSLDRLTDPVTGRPGVHLRFLDADGNEVWAGNRRGADLGHLRHALPDGATALELRTRYRPARTGAVRLGVTCVRHVRMQVDGVQVVDEKLAPPQGPAMPPSVSGPVDLTAGTEVEIVVRLELPAPGEYRPPFWLSLGIDLATAAPEQRIADAVEAARAADVAVVVVGTNAWLERETMDRASLSLPGHQDELVYAVARANPRTVVVVNAGAPVLMPWRDEVAAVLLTWFGGQEFGNALTDVLLGRTEPGGRLPTTWPATEDGVPVLSTTPAGGLLEYAEGIHVGYRAWLRAGVTPAYPFGFGLGYTDWELGSPEPAAAGAGEAVEVTVAVRNKGDRAGKQVVQAYLSRADSEIERPVRWLAGHTVVRADAGDEQDVTIRIEPRSFAHWDDGWHVEPGTYTVHVGTSAADLPRSTRIRIT